MSTKPYFQLYAHNIAVKGSTRSAIYDLQRQDIVLIPNVLHRVLRHLVQHPWRETQQAFAPGNPVVFQQYIDFLLRKDLGFFLHNPASFPALSLAWNSPHHVQNAVISYAFAHYHLGAVLAQLDQLQCQHLELRLRLPGQNWPEVLALFEQMAAMSFASVSLLLAYSEAVPDEQQLRLLYEHFPKIQHIIVHDAPYGAPSAAHPEHVVFVTADLQREQPRDRYIVNSEFFTEAMRFNPYYNRKLCVDDAGYIKNCLLQPKRFANVNTTRLATVLQDADFQELWHAAPDQTVGLQDSELRYAHFSADYLVRDTGSGLFNRVSHPAAVPALDLVDVV
ncbi:hypothetical protein [Hymenobacter negativus]|uniref:Glycosyltransferase family 1 protein n=1 Tax=Hymenobacter negativus TaxID=2795026 RepID=A0ABS3QPH8_9BACT|nr:hypothetical protein [Hymenobacter negativus]MBO2013097.1 hypothetical protein [Hymenobacter negativus]